MRQVGILSNKLKVFADWQSPSEGPHIWIAGASRACSLECLEETGKAITPSSPIPGSYPEDLKGRIT
jgi:hypothetical protein